MADNIRKSVTFQVKLDNSEFGPTIENMKRQFSDAASSMMSKQAQGQSSSRLSQQGFGGIMSLPKPEEVQKSRRAMDLFIREQAQQQEKLYRLTQRQEERIDKISTIEKSMLKGSQDQLKVKERLIAAQERLNSLNEQYQRRNLVLNQALNLQGGRGGGMAPPGIPGTGMPGATGGGGTAGAVGGFLLGGSLMTVAAGIGKAVDVLAGFPMRLEEAKGSAAQSFAGRDIRAMQSGASAFETAWLPERAKAAEMAQDKRQWNQRIDRFLGTVSALSIGLGGVLTATGIGAPVGMGMMAAGAAGLYNDRNRSAMFGMNMGNTDLLNKQQGQDMLSTWEALKQQDPRKGAAIDYLQQNYGQNLQMQRMMGLGDQGYLGADGFQQTATGAGFTPDLANAMAAQIQGAGGSTRGMRGGSTLALQAQRGFDLTNAGTAYGRISGGAGGTQQSDAVFRRMMEESIKAGLDKSEFREEQRRFVDTTSEILSRAGIQTAEQAGRALQGFSKYVGNEPTIRGLEGAKTSYQEEQAFSAETTGRGGAIGFAEMLNDPLLRKLDPMAMAGLQEMPDEAITPTNPRVVAFAQSIGISPEELAKRIHAQRLRKKTKEVGLNPERTEKMYGRMAEMGFQGALSKEELAQFAQTAPEEAQTYQEVMRAGVLKNEYQGPQKMAADVMRYSSGGRQGRMAGPGGQVAGPAAGGYDERMAVGAEGRAGDEAVRALGGAAELTIKNFMSLRDVITPNVAALERFLNAVLSLNTAISTGITNKEALERYMKANPVGNQKQVTGKRQQ
jgi:hypothetical protein